MAVGVLLIEMDIEADDILLAITLCHEVVHIPRPVLDVLATGDATVVRPLTQVDFLTAKGELVHPLTVAAKDELGNGAVLPFAVSVTVRVPDAAGCQVLSHLLSNALGCIYRLYDTSPYDLKIELCPGRVIVRETVSGLLFPLLRCPVALLFIALLPADAVCLGAHIHDLFSSCHIRFY